MFGKSGYTTWPLEDYALASVGRSSNLLTDASFVRRTSMGSWNARWSDPNIIAKWQSPPRKALVALAQELKARNLNKVLDIGCGPGRHVIYFAREGFEVHASDIAESAVYQCEEWLKKEQLSATVAVRGMADIPYPDGYFHLVIASGVLYYSTIEKMRLAIQAIHRKLAAGGYLYATIRSTANPRFGKGVMLERNTFCHDGKGSPIHFSDEEEVTVLFSGFDVLSRKHGTGRKATDPTQTRGMWELILRKPVVASPQGQEVMAMFGQGQ
jgi:SAM-dependent methyltransferase